MKVFTSSLKAKSFCQKGAAITIGNFDGVHRGHQDILKKLITKAKQLKIPSVVYTFKPHPVKVLSPHNAPKLIQTLPQKIELLKNQGVDAVVLEPFTRKFASLTAKPFFEKILKNRLNSRFILVGYDFTFGAKRSGNRDTLKQLCDQHDIDLLIEDAFFVKDTLSSSSLVRKEISEGDIVSANKLLGRPYFIDGVIVKGDGRGRTIGVPTANLDSDQELLPDTGVYATIAEINKKKYASVTNIGKAPTFGEHPLRIECHLIGQEMNLYKKKMRLHFLYHLRNEKKFSDQNELIKQIHADIKKAKQKAS